MGKILERRQFLYTAIKEETDNCIIWKWDLKNRYPRIMIDGQSFCVPHLVLLLTVGQPPTANHVAAHAPKICHNKKCINKRHLRWATQSENLADRDLDGTNIVGERNGRSKLSNANRLDIKQDTRDPKEICNDYNVSLSQIYRIRRQ